MGRTAAYGDLRAFIARPKAEGPLPGFLLWVPALNDQTRAAAEARAAANNVVVVLFAAGTDPAAARAWFDRMDGLSTRTEEGTP